MPNTSPFRALPQNPSLDSLRKQAKTLARDVAGGDAEAIARVQAQLSNFKSPLSARDAQLVLAREYGFDGWFDLRAEVLMRLGKGPEWAALEAEHAIHDNKSERLKELIAEYPALITDDDLRLGLLDATTAFTMDASDPERERQFFRPECAEILIDAGATIDPPILESVIGRGARNMLGLYQRKGILPRTLNVLAALDDIDGVHAMIGEAGLATASEALMTACHFKHRDPARALLDRCIALDPAFGERVEAWTGRWRFIDYVMEHYISLPQNTTPWKAVVFRRLLQATEENDLADFEKLLKAESWLLGTDAVPLQIELTVQAMLRGRRAFIESLLDLKPAILLRSPVSISGDMTANALTGAFEYGRANLVPVLARIWPVPDDLPHAAGLGNLERVKQWFDSDGRPALGDLSRHFPANNTHKRRNLHWGAPNVQQVLDTALAWSCMNNQFEVAKFLLEHGADINTDWCTHEPASILHECVGNQKYEAAQFLIDHGIDLSIRDYRWHATAAGWAYNATNDEKMFRLLTDAAEAQGLKLE